MATGSPLVIDYLNLTKEYQQKYGESTIVLMQVGAFFEMYGLKSSDTIKDSRILEVCNICQLNISDKKICVGKDEVVMAGFRDYNLDKYVSKITDAGFTVAVYIQEKNDKVVSRSLYSVFSPGTYISHDTDSSPQITNNIICIWMDVIKSLRSVKENLICGISVANIFTGKSFMFEYEIPFYMNPTTFDELEHYVSIFNPSEVIFISPFDNDNIRTILQYSGIKCNIHRIDSKNVSNEKVQNCMKQKYISHILGSFFGEESVQICSEFENYIMATQSFCYLLDFIQEHNPNLVRKISMPTFNNISTRMILANHTLKQLNIIDDTGNQYGNMSSILSFLNKCCSPMGKRLFQYQLTNPTFDRQWLQTEYDMISIMLNNYHFVELFRKQLFNLRDMEKINRQLVIRKLYPSSIHYLYSSIVILQQINECLAENPEISKYLVLSYDKNSPNEYIKKITNGITSFLDDHLIIEKCKSLTSTQTFVDNIIKKGISSKLDELLEKRELDNIIFNEIQSYFNGILRINENKSSKTNDNEYIKKHETEKSGISLQLTKKRATTLKNILSTIKNKTIHIQAKSFDLSEVKFISASTNADEISFPLLNKITKELLNINSEIDQVISSVYEEVLIKFEKLWFNEIELLSEYAARLDVLQCKTYTAKINNYCKPQIQESKKSFVRATEVRHCLIEHIQTNEVYVANDIHIGCDMQDGMLLYGTNAVGKTSLIRALGIAVILAQCGMYVPCSQFAYHPYTAIYSRILGNDNLFKGLSTFVVEMSELRTILKMSNENSLILGDEVCSGTETESALSIFVSALMDLHDKQSSFIFATHFHEIVQYDEIKQLCNMVLCHMSVVYDREQDCLVYDRKLQYGPGNRMYGLEVCKSLYLPNEFLERAYNIRNKYYPENRGELSHNSSVYNSKKIRGICEKCNSEIAKETHHLSPQKDASDTGFIGSFHKNHPANLMALCEKCHDELHKKDTKIKRKKTTKGYIVS
jgi:DNA mismatch repair protein MutS